MEALAGTEKIIALIGSNWEKSMLESGLFTETFQGAS